MPSVRFTAVVKAAGRPEVHLVLTDPRLDPVLRRALKENRVMTVHQATVGTKADYGTVGFAKDPTGQVLLFPRPLTPFANKTVVGIKYDLFAEPGSSDRLNQARDRDPEKGVGSVGPRFHRFVRRPGRPAPPPGTRRRGRAPEQPPGSDKVVEFPREPGDEAEAEEAAEKTRTSPETRPTPRIKPQLQRALEALEEGRQVVAYQILRQVLDQL